MASAPGEKGKKMDVNEFAPAEPLNVDAPAEPEIVQIEPAKEPVTTFETPLEPPTEPNAPNAYESIISQQTEQINALIAQNQSLTDQITKLVHGGGQITSAQPGTTNPLSQLSTPSLASDEDWSLEALAKDIGRRKH